MMDIMAAALLVVGGVMLVVAAWGVIALPDALSRQHAATKAGTFALTLVCLGALIAVGNGEWSWRLVLIVGFLLATLPVASHLLARAAVREMNAEATISQCPLVGDDPAASPTAPR